MTRIARIVAAVAIGLCTANAVAGESTAADGRSLSTKESAAMQDGRRLFTKDAAPPCALCHTLKDAGAAGAIGPSLDELKPDRQRVIKAVRGGIGAMPPFTSLSDKDVEAIADYVSKASGGAN